MTGDDNHLLETRQPAGRITGAFLPRKTTFEAASPWSSSPRRRLGRSDSWSMKSRGGFFPRSRAE